MADQQQININTRNTAMTNGYARIPSAMKVTYWNDMVKLEFFPELPESKRTETRRYDYDNGWVTCISRGKCNELFRQYEEAIRPALLKKEQKTISIPIAGVNLITISTGVDDMGQNDGDTHPYIELVKNIDPETLKASPNSSIMYEFNKGGFIEDYNKAGGTFKARVLTDNEFDTFMQDLNAFREASSKSYVHAARCVDRAYKDSITNALNKIGEKVGADMTFNVYNRDGMGHGSIFDGRNGGKGAEAPNQQYNDIDDLGSLLN